MPRLSFLYCGLACLTCLLVVPAVSGQDAAEKITYDDHAKPVFLQRCGSCHNGQRREGDLDVTNYINLMQGGGSGPVIEPQDASGSYLYSLIIHEDSPEMPPSGTKIPDPEIELIAKWINMGALENKGSKAAKAKPKLNMAISENPTARPEVAPVPKRMPLEPVIRPDVPSVLTIATSPWAPVAAVSTPKQILLYNTASLEIEGVLPFEEGVAHSLRFSRNGQYLLAGGGKDGAMGKAILFNVLTGERVTSVGEELETLLAADISPSQEYVAFGGPNKLVKLLYTDGTMIAEIGKHTDWITAMEFSPDGKYLATGDRNGGLHIWDGQTGSEVFTLGGHTGQISAISWRVDGAFVASASEDNTVRIWEMKEGKQIKSWGAHGGGTTSMEFCRNGNLVTAGRDKLVKLWDQNGKELKQFPGLTDVAVAVSFCDESDRVLAADWTGQVRVWNAADGNHLGNLDANPPTLAERIAASEQAVAQAAAKHEPLAAQLAQTQATIQTMEQQLATAKQTAESLQVKLADEEKQLAAAKQQFESTSAQHQQWMSEHGTKTGAQPLIAQSLQKAQEAAAALPEDAELKSAVATLDQKAKQLESRLAELAGLIEKSTQEKATSKAQMDQLVAAVTETQQQMASTTTEVNQVEGELTKLKETMATQAAQANQAQQTLQAEQSRLEKWKANVAFIEQLKALKDQLAQSRETVAQRQAAVDAVHQELVAVQQRVDSAKQEKAAAEQQTNALQEQINALRDQ